MEYTNKYEVALFVMCRQRLVQPLAVTGKSPQEVDVAAYRAMQELLNDEDVISSAVELENAKRIAEVYG